MKKLFTLFFAVMAGVGMMFASDTQVDGIWYDFNNYSKVATVTYQGSNYYSYSNEYSGDIVIPDSVTYNDIKYGVTSIKSGAFYGCANLSSITIGNSVKNIGERAFSGCTNLKSVTWNAIHCNDFNEDNTPFYYTKDSYFAYDLRPQITSFIIGSDVEYLPSYLCAGMNNIEEKVLACDIHCGLHAIENSKFSQPDANLTELPDTVICAGEMICKGEKVCTYSYSYYDSFDDNPGYEWNREAYEKGESWPRCYNCGEYEVSEMYQEFTEWVYSHEQHNVTDATECPDGMKCTEQCPGCQRYYSNTTIKQTYTNVKGCDSIVVRNIIMSKVQLPRVVTKPAIGEPNTGSIQIYDNNDGELASYGYFTLNGELISHASGTEGTPYVISDLLPGVYNLVFYTELGCDSASVSCEITAQGMKIGDFYYNFITKERVWNSTSSSYEYVPCHYAEVTSNTCKSNDCEKYSGHIIIPDRVSWLGEDWPVGSIGKEAFKATNIESIVVSENVTHIDTNAFYQCEKLQYVKLLNNSCELEYCIIEHKTYDQQMDYTYAGLIWHSSASGINTYWKDFVTIPVYVPYGTLEAYNSEYYNRLNFHVINHYECICQINATSATITFGREEDASHIAACGMIEGDTTTGNFVEYIGLEPNSAYNGVAFFIDTKEGDHDTLHYSFKTAELTLTTQESKPVSSTTAILLAQTNMADIETGCGFEWKPSTAPDDYTGPMVQCPVANGLMAGRLKGLESSVFYKYRAYYKSATGKMYYGDWKYIYTGTGSVEFEPIVYTYAATGIKDDEATLKGCAIAGADDFTEQGFEYWAESRVSAAQHAPARMKASIGERQTIAATGMSMKVTLTDLDAGTVYKYRTYAKTGDQISYGSEMSFTTKGEYVDESATAIDEIVIEETETGKQKTEKLLRDGQLLILRDGKTYTVTGQRL